MAHTFALLILGRPPPELAHVQVPPSAAAVPVVAFFSAFVDRGFPCNLDTPLVGTLFAAVAADRCFAVDGSGVPRDRIRLRCHVYPDDPAPRPGAPDRAGDPYRDRVRAGGTAADVAVAGAVVSGNPGTLYRAGGCRGGAVAVVAGVRFGVRVGRCVSRG